MNNQSNHDYSPIDPEARTFPEPLRADRLTSGKAPKAPRRLWGLPIAFAATAVVGIALGSASAGGTPEPERVEVKVPVETIVKTTPSVCIDALDDAEAVSALTSEALGYSQNATEGAAAMDLGAMRGARADLEALVPKVLDAVDTYNTSSALCRASN